MGMNERCIELLEDLKVYISSEGLALITKQEDFEQLLGFCKNYQLLYLDGSKMFIYHEYKEYSVPLASMVENYTLFTKDVLKDKCNYFLSVSETDSKGNIKIKLENVSTFFLRYRLAEPKSGLDFIITKTPVKHNKINLWRGFNDIEQVATDEDIKPFLDLLYINVAGENKDQYEYALKYFAHMLLKPYELPRVAIVMPGVQGLGKDSVLEIISKWLNPINYVKLTSTSDLVGFNKLLEGKFVMFADEATFAYDKSTAGVLKNLITSNTMLIERKGVDKYAVNNYGRLIIASNNTDEAALIEANDRRYFVFDTQSKLDKAFFETFYYELENNNLAGKVMFWLKNNIDISTINFERDMPKTKSHAFIQSDKLPDIIRFIKSVALGDFENEGLVFKYSKSDDDFILQAEGDILFRLFKDVYRKSERTVLDKNKFGIMLKKIITYKKSNTMKYYFSIKEIIQLLDTTTKNPHHSLEIQEHYKSSF